MISIGVTMKKEPSDNTTHLIRAFFVNKSQQQLIKLNLQVAVQKYMKLQMFQANSTEMQPYSQMGQVTQDMKIQNSMEGQKPLALKIRVLYTIAATGQEIAETKVINALG